MKIHGEFQAHGRGGAFRPAARAAGIVAAVLGMMPALVWGADYLEGRVVGLEQSHGLVNGLPTAQVRVQNTSREPVALEYTFRWLDSAAEPVAQDPWRPCFLGPEAEDVLRSIAMKTNARNARLDIRAWQSQTTSLQLEPQDYSLAAFLIAQKLLSHPVATGEKVIMVQPFENRTVFPMHGEWFADKLSGLLVNSHRFRLLSSPARHATRDRTMNAAREAEPAEASALRLAPEYLLTGALDAADRRLPEGQARFYQITARLTQIATGIVVCSADATLQKIEPPVDQETTPAGEPTAAGGQINVPPQNIPEAAGGQ